MSVISGQNIRALCNGLSTPPMLDPFHERTVFNGKSFGLSIAGYDVRCAEPIHLPPGAFRLASTVEKFWMPPNVIGFVHDKSTWAREGLAVQNTVIEPGWRGFLTLELTNHNDHHEIMVLRNDPIAQIVFHWVDMDVEKPYDGKYQDQEAGPQVARYESKATRG